MMENEVVSKKKWMSREHFLDLIGATNLIPGPNSTEMAMHCGYHRAGWLGMLVAGMGFIIPATLITGAIAWFYQQYGSIPDIKPIWYGIRPAVLAIIINAVYRFGKKALKNWQLGIIGAAVMAASLAGMSEVLILLAGGLLGMFWLSFGQKNGSMKESLFPLLLLPGKPEYLKTEIAAIALSAGQLAGNYRETYSAEPEVHESTGPHGGNVRTYYNSVLVGDLKDGKTIFSKGAAMVKELYFDGKEEVIGYAVMIKVRKDSGNSGQGWLFYESFDGTNKDAIFGRGLPECADCHSVGVDFLRSSFRP